MASLDAYIVVLQSSYMSEEHEERKNYNSAVSGGGIIGLIILALIGWWAYSTFFKDYSKTWWSGTSVQNVCVVHNPNDSSCFNASVTAENGRVTSLSLPNGGTAIISTNDCDKSDIDGGLAGKGKRYCVIGEIAGGREWQVSEN